MGRAAMPASRGGQSSRAETDARTAAKLGEAMQTKAADQARLIATKLLRGEKASHLDWAKVDGFEAKRQRAVTSHEQDASPGPGHYDVRAAERRLKARGSNGALRWHEPPQPTKRTVSDRTEGRDMRDDLRLPSCFDAKPDSKPRARRAPSI